MEEQNQITEGGQLSKKEARELRRREKLESRSSETRKRMITRIAVWSGVVAVIGALIFTAIKYGSNSDTGSNPIPAILSNDISESDWSLGNKDAKVSLIEYGDYQCPACGAYHPLVKQLMQEFGNDVRFAARHFPLRQVHPNADLAARAAEAAGRQGKFWEMHDMLFERQNDWSAKSRPKNIFADYAGRIGIDQARFELDIELDEVKQEVQQDFSSGNASGVSSTPTFFLNGTKIKNPQGYEEFKKLISDAIQASH